MSWAFQFFMRAYTAFKYQDPVPNYAIQYPKTESFNGKILSHTELMILLLKVMCISNSISGIKTFPIKILNALVYGWVAALCACVPHISISTLTLTVQSIKFQLTQEHFLI